MSTKPFLLLEADMMKFVEEHHSKQKYGDYPYHVHLYQAHAIAVRHGCNEDVRLSVLGHDLFEDTHISKRAVIVISRERVARIIYLVTDGKGWTREEKHRNTYPEIAKDQDAISVKLCDRNANITFGLSTENIDKLRTYIFEHSYFYKTLRSIHQDDHNESLWNEYLSLIEKARELLDISDEV